MFSASNTRLLATSPTQSPSPLQRRPNLFFATLATTIAATSSALIDPTSTLRERGYYSHLDAATDPYPIVPKFCLWTFAFLLTGNNSALTQTLRRRAASPT